MKLFSKKNNRAFTLVETLVAISIFTMSILGLMSILASGITNTTYAKQKMVASYLAQEGIEHVRNLRDTSVLYDGAGAQHGWDNFKTNINTIINCPITSCPIVNSDFPSFTRTISADIVSFGSDEVKITSTVTWTQGSGPQTVTFSENLFNWVK